MQGSGFRVQGSGLSIQGAGFRVQGSGFRVQGSGFTVHGSRFRVRGLGFRVLMDEKESTNIDFKQIDTPYTPSLVPNPASLIKKIEYTQVGPYLNKPRTPNPDPYALTPEPQTTNS